MTVKIKRAVFYCLLLALASYGLDYHIAKAFIHLAVLLSIANISLALKDKSFRRLSTKKTNIIMISTLLTSSLIIFIYYLIYQNPISERHFSSMAYPALFFATILPSLKIEDTDRNILLYTGIFSCIAMAGSGIIDYISNSNPGHRTSGFLNMPIIYASCMVILTSWMSAEFFKNLSSKKWPVMILCSIAICAGFSATLFTGSRGPIIANIIILAVLFLHYIISSPASRSKNYSLLTFLTLFSIATLFLSQSALLDNVKNRFEIGINNISNGFEDERRPFSSAGVRLDMWEASLISIGDHPYTGIGPGIHTEYFPILDQEKRINMNITNITQFDHMHNDFIQSWLSMGLILGTMALFFIIYPALLFIINIKNNKSSMVGFSICLGFILCGLTDAPAHKASSLTLFLLLICIQLAIFNHYKDTKREIQQ